MTHLQPNIEQGNGREMLQVLQALDCLLDEPQIIHHSAAAGVITPLRPGSLLPASYSILVD
jgi:hypothetical protein